MLHFVEFCDQLANNFCVGGVTGERLSTNSMAEDTIARNVASSLDILVS
jgi:hypothetical protein